MFSQLDIAFRFVANDQRHISSNYRYFADQLIALFIVDSFKQ